VIDPRGEPIDVLSPNVPANLEADKRAFVAFECHHLREIDGASIRSSLCKLRTNLALWAARGLFPAAENQFQAEVPPDLVKSLHKHSGTWKQVFGADADETFAAYSFRTTSTKWRPPERPSLLCPCTPMFGSSIRVVPYPVLTIRVVAHPQYAGRVESGRSCPGHDWPDIYTDDSELYRLALTTYHRPDNPCWVPETGGSDADAQYFFYAPGRRRDWNSRPLGWITRVGPFTDRKPPARTVRTRLVAPMDREIARLNFEVENRENCGNPKETVALPFTEIN